MLLEGYLKAGPGAPAAATWHACERGRFMEPAPYLSHMGTHAPGGPNGPDALEALARGGCHVPLPGRALIQRPRASVSPSPPFPGPLSPWLLSSWLPTAEPATKKPGFGSICLFQAKPPATQTPRLPSVIVRKPKFPGQHCAQSGRSGSCC